MVLYQGQDRFDHFQLSHEEQRPGVPGAQPRVALDQAGRKLPDPFDEFVRLSPHDQIGRNSGDQAGRAFQIPGRQGVLDSLIEGPLVLIPLAGPAVQLGDSIRFGEIQPLMEEIRK